MFEVVVEGFFLYCAGRGGNKWLSPMGCAMFTIVVRIPINSHLGNALPFLQHIASVAVVLGIRNIPELEVITIRNCYLTTLCAMWLLQC